jgi:hypothetical protein
MFVFAGERLVKAISAPENAPEMMINSSRSTKSVSTFLSLFKCLTLYQTQGIAQVAEAKTPYYERLICRFFMPLFRL